MFPCHGVTGRTTRPAKQVSKSPEAAGDLRTNEQNRNDVVQVAWLLPSGGFVEECKIWIDWKTKRMWTLD